MYELLPQNGMERLAGGLRDQLQTMTAAVYALTPHVAGNEKAVEYLAALDRAICTQLHLILQGELARRLFGPSELRSVMAPMDLAELGRNVMARTDELTRPLLGIRAEFSSSLAVLPTRADRAILERMLLIFLSNSVRAIGRDGTIRLELARQRDQAVFTLTDTGCGLDPDALADLFGPDDALDDEPDDALDDTLDDTLDDALDDTLDDTLDGEPDGGPEDIPVRGLLLAQRIAALHGGTVVAGNTEAGGARMVVSLPLVERTRGILRSPAIPEVEAGGWDPVLVSLAGSLPTEAFLPGLNRL